MNGPRSPIALQGLVVRRASPRHAEAPREEPLSRASIGTRASPGARAFRYLPASALRHLPAFIVLLGAVVRLRQFIFNRSLWVDEAGIAINIIRRTYAGLLEPLQGAQTAPIGFLWTQKTLVNILGSTDMVFRIFPLAAGLTALLLMPFLLRPGGTLLRRLSAALALCLFAFNGRLIYFASEAKQYSVDVLVTIVLLLLARQCWRKDWTSADCYRFGIGGVLAVWFSHPSVFVLAGLCTGLALSRLAAKQWNGFWLIAATAVVQAASFLLVYMLALRSSLEASSGFLNSFWQAAFAPMPPWNESAWYTGTFSNALTDPAGLTPKLLSTALIMIGLARLIARGWELVAGLAVAIVAAIAASAMQSYPLTGRLLLFGLPAAYLLTVEGVRGVQGVLIRWNRPLALVATLVISALLIHKPAAASFETLQHPYVGEDIRSVMAYLQRHRLADDVIYVYYGAIPAFSYYAPFYGISDGGFTWGVWSPRSPDGYISDIERFRGRKRVWFVFSHVCANCATDELRLYIGRLEQVGKRIMRSTSAGTGVYLYDLTVSN